MAERLGRKETGTPGGGGGGSFWTRVEKGAGSNSSFIAFLSFRGGGLSV